MAKLVIEVFRNGTWNSRQEGDYAGTAEDVAKLLPAYCLQYDHRAFLDGVLVAECQPKRRGRR